MNATHILLKNYWCPKCRQWVAAVDTLCGKHVDCNTRVEWREFVPEVFRTVEMAAQEQEA